MLILNSNSRFGSLASGIQSGTLFSNFAMNISTLLLTLYVLIIESQKHNYVVFSKILIVQTRAGF